MLPLYNVKLDAFRKIIIFPATSGGRREIELNSGSLPPIPGGLASLDRAIPHAYSIGLIAFAHNIIYRTEKISSNDVAMATIAYASRVLTPQQQQQEQVDNRLS